MHPSPTRSRDHRTVNPNPVEPTPPVAAAAAAATPAVGAAAWPAASAAATRAGAPWWALAVVLVLAAVALWFAWQTQSRLQSLEHELVRRQQDSATLATEARVLARQSQDVSRDAAAKVALLESRVAENTLQRSQLEELLQALTRSRDENMLADIEAAVRVAVQQSLITGSTEPLLVTLKQADERLARNSQPRLERVRRAVAKDLDRVRAVAVSDIATLVIKLDEAVRLADEMPLLAQPERRRVGKAVTATGATTAAAPNPAAAPAAAGARTGKGAAASTPAASAASAAVVDGWRGEVAARWNALTQHVLDEARSLLRVTRIDDPDAMLIAPEQAYFLRENIKLRLLNARLALLARQFGTAQSDLRDVQQAVDKYFDRSSKRVVTMNELLRQVAGQARGVIVPRPDETLAALAAVTGHTGR
ncbi:MAG: uroporphyrinogen-III C-methyltransferase [Ideonella sp.]|nr:uroporphyrinogen-III C-methyltransferase [Ideonella sp.]